MNEHNKSWHNEIRVLIAASGSGGHLFPAVFIARAFKRQDPNTKIEFVGSGRPLEEKIVGGAGFPINRIPVVGVKHRGIIGLLQFLLLFPLALLRTIKLFIRFKPQVVVGVGGYVTFFPIVLAYVLRIPTWIHEAELKPGLANAILSRIANRISVAFEEASLNGKNKVDYTGHPVRETMRQVTSGLPDSQSPTRILVLGGSQGAVALDKVMVSVAGDLAKRNIEVWHQCRTESTNELKEAYRQSALIAKVEPFIEDMAGAYSWADILVARSGAGTLMEASVVNRPTLFVPYPSAQGDHQTANAMTMVRPGKALIVKEGEGFESRFRDELYKLLEPNFYHEMRKKPYEARSLNAADRIVEGCLQLIR